MSRYRGPRLRIIRRLGELPGLTSKIPRKQDPPGQHGPNKGNQGGRKRKESQYSVRLKEKQKLRFHYGITESQLLKYVREARNSKGSTGELILQRLEMRLDSILFRLGMAPSIASARQLISHGHIHLNGNKVDIPSYRCEKKDKISVAPKKHSRQLIDSYLENSRQLPTHLTLHKDRVEGVVDQIVDRASISLKINELLVVEFYSRKV